MRDRERQWRRGVAAPDLPPGNVNGDGRRRRRSPQSTASEIRRLRKAQCLTQADLAAMTGVTQQAIAKLEREPSNPTMTTLREVAVALGFRLVVRFKRETR